MHQLFIILTLFLYQPLLAGNVLGQGTASEEVPDNDTQNSFEKCYEMYETDCSLACNRLKKTESALQELTEDQTKLKNAENIISAAFSQTVIELDWWGASASGPQFLMGLVRAYSLNDEDATYKPLDLLGAMIKNKLFIKSEDNAYTAKIIGEAFLSANTSDIMCEFLEELFQETDTSEEISKKSLEKVTARYQAIKKGYALMDSLAEKGFVVENWERCPVTETNVKSTGIKDFIEDAATLTPTEIDMLIEAFQTIGIKITDYTQSGEG